MTLKELRKLKELTQLEASLISNIPLRSYKRLENDNSYVNSFKYQHAYSLIEQYKGNKNNSINNKTITVAGLGYVGLSNAVILAQHNKVYALDINDNRINLIKNKISNYQLRLDAKIKE